MQLFHDKAIKKTYFGMRVIGAQRLLDSLRDSLLERSVLLLSPPLCNLGQAGLTEMFVNELVLALVGREERKQVSDPAFSNGGGQVVNGLLRQEGAEDDGDDVNRNI